MTRLKIQIIISPDLPVGEGWALDIAARDLGERLRPLPAADYLPTLHSLFSGLDMVTVSWDERVSLITLADGLYDQLRTISEGRHALSDEAQVLRLLDRVRGMKP